MTAKRDPTFDALILDCDCYLAIDNVTMPANYRGQVREIRHAAQTSERYDRVMLGRLEAELLQLSSFWTTEHRANYERLQRGLQRLAHPN